MQSTAGMGHIHNEMAEETNILWNVYNRSAVLYWCQDWRCNIDYSRDERIAHAPIYAFKGACSPDKPTHIASACMSTLLELRMLRNCT